MLNTILNAIFGSNGGMKLRDIKKTLQRIHFSDYLPWIAYDEETEVFVNKDETAGFIWECSPICFAGEQTAGTLKGLLNMGLPHGSIMQFILYADHDIEPFLSDYKSKKTVSHPLIKTAVDRFCSFLSSGTEGLENLQGTPVRNFRLFLSIKFPISAKVDINEIKTFTEEILRGAYLHPRLLRPEDLLLWMRRYFNTTASKNDKNYNETIPISKQIILSETDIKTSFTSIKVGERTFKCMTPKSFPYEIDLLSTNKIFGGIWGIISDSDQINAPFLYTLNIFFQDLKKSLHAKCNLIIQQQGFGSFAPSLQRKKEEYLWATEELDKGTPFVKIIPIIWTWSRDEKKVNSALSRIRRIWESQGYIMQADKGILPILFISALPFGLYNKGKNIETMERDFITPIDTLSVLFPIQSDFSGGGDPLMLFVGRKGQICPLNIFDPSATNHNIFIAAGTGGGKSFLVNSMVFNHYSAGDLIRIIDIGGSYKKMAKIFSGKYLEFKDDSICLNPFSNVVDPQYDLPVIASVVEQMAYSSSNTLPSETEKTVIKNAVSWAWANYHEEAGVDRVHEYLESFPKHATELDFDCEDKEECSREITHMAHTLAYNLTKYTSDGEYGKLFNGKSNFSISQDHFLVLELEHLKPRPDLFKVVVLQIINAVTNDLYLSDRSKRRFIILDEAWQFLNADSTLKKVIEEGYRRARKYGGSFTVVTQSVLDLKMFGDVGDVINANSAFKFYLQSEDIEKVKEEKLIDLDEFSMNLLKTVRTSPPRYSEIYMKTPFGSGVARLVVDPFSYYVYTSKASDIAKIEELVKSGMNYHEAIEVLVD